MITENQLDAWVNGHQRDAQGLIPELIKRLVAASSPKPKERRFHHSDSIGQPGPDGFLDTDFDFKPFVPEGISYWEIGTGKNAGRKATTDYKELTTATPEEVRRESTFIFVTPLSGTGDWQYTWKEDAQETWIKKKRELHEWKDVQVIDGTRLIDWLSSFPPVEQWFACAMGLPAHQTETLEQRWSCLKEIGSPPPLTSDIFLANRNDACDKLKSVFDGTTIQLKLETHFSDQMADFIAAYVESMEKDAKLDAVGRSLIISNVDAWNTMMDVREQQILVANFDLEDDAGIKLLDRARRVGHRVIYQGLPGGIPLPLPNRAHLPSPRTHQIREALEKSGFKTERARILSQKCDGNLSSLLRLLHNLSLMPEWAQETDASELAIAQLLGAWRDQSGADREAAENLSGKAYGGWIKALQEIVRRPNTPLNHHNDTWKIVSRYEAWYALGPKLFDEHLGRFKKIVVEVLKERDPQFELPPDKRFMASIYDEVLTHSYPLRRGMAESLALIGSHPEALKSCSTGKANETAVLAIHEILSDADWVLWGSLNDLLPLLAEAAPDEFLTAVETALNYDKCPFETLFEQEGSGIVGRNYMTGLLWALETLAWDADYLIRVVVILGELAEKDHGGNWSNRPANSLSTIFLPWFPQTCAPVPKRNKAVRVLITEHPEVAWNLLLSLLPKSHQISHGSRKPTWREIIPDDWFERASTLEYWEQVDTYAELTTSAAMSNLSKLVSLIDRLNDFPPQARDRILAYLGSDAVISMPEAERVSLWAEITNLIKKHRKFADADWAMKAEEVDKISAIAEKLTPKSPIYRHRRLFSERDFDLYEIKGNHEEQCKALADRRQKAIVEIFALEGMEAVLKFARAVESPWDVGFALGVSAKIDAEPSIFPSFLDSEDNSLVHFVGGFVRGRFWSRQWQWVDEINTNTWTASQKGQFLAFLPFASDTWRRATQLLGEDESPYWSKTRVCPDGDDKNLEMAIDRLIENGRAHEAILCFEQMRYKKRLLNSRQAVRVLQAMLHSSDDLKQMDAYAVVEVIKALQDDMSTNPNDLSQIEFAFLPLLDGHHGASPKLLEQRLADDPEFFCEIIHTVFRSTKEDDQAKEQTEQQKNIASCAYNLLHNWRTPPGCQKDGTYNGEALTVWIEKVNEICRDSGHLEVGHSRVGQVLIHIPPDSDGFWMNHSAARVLNSKENKKIRDGFFTGMINARGGHLGTSGNEERKLAAKYRDRAEETEDFEYHRLASTIRKLAAFYERDAEREESRDLYDE